MFRNGVGRMPSMLSPKSFNVRRLDRCLRPPLRGRMASVFIEDNIAAAKSSSIGMSGCTTATSKSRPSKCTTVATHTTGSGICCKRRSKRTCRGVEGHGWAGGFVWTRARGVLHQHLRRCRPGGRRRACKFGAVGRLHFERPIAHGNSPFLNRLPGVCGFFRDGTCAVCRTKTKP